MTSPLTDDLPSLWRRFKSQHMRQYANDEEEAHRFTVFSSNMQDLAEMQAVHPDQIFGPTRYSDLEDKEVAAARAAQARLPPLPAAIPPTPPAAPQPVIPATKECRKSKERRKWRAVSIDPASSWQGLMPDGFDAQASEPLVLRQFLTADEIATCLAAATARGPMPGVSPLALLRAAGLGALPIAPCESLRRVPQDHAYSSEHVVLYLHRESYFKSRWPSLWQKMMTGMRSQDGEWGDAATPLSVRCCELHTYSAGGHLMDPSHTDEGAPRLPCPSTFFT